MLLYFQLCSQTLPAVCGLRWANGLIQQHQSPKSIIKSKEN